MAGAAPGGAQERDEADDAMAEAVATNPQRDADIATIDGFYAAFRTEAPAAQILPLYYQALEAEPRLDVWSTFLPPRDAVRSALAFLAASLQLNASVNDNALGRINMVDFLAVTRQAGSSFSYEHDPVIWRSVQTAELVNSAAGWALFGPASPPAEQQLIRSTLQNRVQSLFDLADRFSDIELATLNSAAANIYASSDATVPGDDVDAALDYARTGTRMALQAQRPDIAIGIANQMMRIRYNADRNGGGIEAITNELRALGGSNWLNRRSTYWFCAEATLAEGDLAMARRCSHLWYMGMRVDLQNAGVPLHIANDGVNPQGLYLVVPIVEGDLPLALHRFTALAELALPTILTDPTVFLPEVAENELSEFTEEEVSLAPPPLIGPIIVGAMIPVRFDVAIKFRQAILRVQAGDASAYPPSTYLVWTNGAAALRSPDDDRNTVVEGGRSAIRVYSQIFDMFPVPSDARNGLDQVDALRSRIPLYEPHFWTSFGKPIDDLAGGSCASSFSRDPAPPTISIMLATSIAIFPVEIARAPNGRRLIDCYDIRRLAMPSEAVASQARWGTTPAPLRQVSAIWNPMGDLPFAAAEQTMIASLLPAPMRDADSASAITLLGSDGIDILHIAAHGEFNPFDPFASRIATAADRSISLRDIAGLDGSALPRLIVLSACEAGLSSPMGGEIAQWGVASAFLRAGAGGVIGPLWRVRDDAAALVMGRFYENLMQRRMSPPASIRAAQLWLRDASRDELETWLDDAAARSLPESRQAIVDLIEAVHLSAEASPGTMPYADPMLWGGFAYFGTYPDD